LVDMFRHDGDLCGGWFISDDIRDLALFVIVAAENRLTADSAPPSASCVTPYSTSFPPAWSTR
jgi:hypothetical protein